MVLLSTSLFAQAPTPPPVNHVLAILTVKEGFPRDQLAKVLPAEVRATVQLYLEGRIEQWYARGDGKGVVFVLNCKTTEEAKSLTEKLPLIKDNLASFEFMTLGPLTPLRFMMQ